MLSNSRHIDLIAKGAAIGFLVGLVSVLGVHGPEVIVRTFEIVGVPVSWFVALLQMVFGLSEMTSALLWWLLHSLYWMVIGGLVGWGVSVLQTKLLGDE